MAKSAAKFPLFAFNFRRAISNRHKSKLHRDHSSSGSKAFPGTHACAKTCGGHCAAETNSWLIGISDFKALIMVQV